MASVGQHGDADVLSVGGTAAVGADAVTLAAAAPAAGAVIGTRVFPAVSPKGVAEAPASSASAALVAVPAAAPVTGGTVFPTASVRGRRGHPLLQIE